MSKLTNKKEIKMIIDLILIYKKHYNRETLEKLSYKKLMSLLHPQYLQKIKELNYLQFLKKTEEDEKNKEETVIEKK